jgi:hypothetical protein
VSESSLPAPGWYPAAHLGGELRYWDGARWSEDAAAPPHPDAEKRRSFLRRPVTRKTGLIVAGSTLVLGLFLGAGLGSSGSTAELSTLQERVTSLEGDVGEAETVASQSDSALAEAESALDDALHDLEEATAELASVTDQIADLETAATTAQAELDARAGRISELENQLAVQPAPAPAPAVPAPATPVSFENCDAVRAAGAAPIRSGQPGYGRHLDRDGDGVGCE